MRVVGYARVSTEDQAATGVSLDAQADRIAAYCAAYGHDVVFVVREAASARDMDREGLRRVLAALRGEGAEGVVVAKLDRLTRSLRDLQALLDEFFSAGARRPRALLSVHEQLDTSTATGRMMVNLLMVVAQWEREMIGERTREALQHKRRAGQRVGGIPYGWRLAEDGRSLAVEPQERRCIAYAQAMRERGMSLRSIGRELQAAGYTQRNGRPWHPETVRSLLRGEGM